jgi:hypothetical protein
LNDNERNFGYVKIMANKPADFPVFTELSEQEIQARIEKLASCLGDIPAMLELPDLQVDAKCIAQIIDKVEKRRIYFHIFHNGMEMGELLNAVRKVADKENKSISISPETIQTIYYAFRYRDLSKEAVMVISKSLVG